jgi:hypothetical protein
MSAAQLPHGIDLEDRRLGGSARLVLAVSADVVDELFVRNRAPLSCGLAGDDD